MAEEEEKVFLIGGKDGPLAGEEDGESGGSRWGVVGRRKRRRGEGDGTG